jgi:hypothetical protein
MTYQPEKIDKDFISLNQILSVVAMILSIIPCFLFWVAYEFFKSYGNSQYMLIIIPFCLYFMWITTIITGHKAVKINKIGVKTNILLVINSLISIPLLLGYVWIILRIMIIR